MIKMSVYLRTRSWSNVNNDRCLLLHHHRLRLHHHRLRLHHHGLHHWLTVHLGLLHKLSLWLRGNVGGCGLLNSLLLAAAVAANNYQDYKSHNATNNTTDNSSNSSFHCFNETSLVQQRVKSSIRLTSCWIQGTIKRAQRPRNARRTDVSLRVVVSVSVAAILSWAVS